jgi:hypothetical protein
MSEPITLYRDGLSVTVTAPSYARELQGQGWTPEPASVDDVGDLPFAVLEVDPESVPDVVPVKAKRGRPRKVTA